MSMLGDDGLPQPAAGAETGAVAVGAMRFGDHLALAFDGDEERYAVLAAYVRDGLESNHKIIYLADQEDADAVLTRLGTAFAATGIDVDVRAAARDGLLAPRPVIEAFMASGRFDPDATVDLLGTEIDLALVQGFKGVRITGETSFSLRGWPGTERFREFEHKCQGAFQAPGTRAMAICQYDRRWFGDDQLRLLLACHDGLVRVDDLHDDGVLRIAPTFTPPGLALSGAVDESTLPALRDALAVAARRDGHLCLDLSGLAFCDTEGLRAMLDTRHAGDGMDRQLVLRAVPGYLALMLRIAGWDRLPGVFVEEAAA
ncbi:MEDS domain-containing protein [Actinomadura rupiterrae]|uniref:MEDS domain-containing protein n=1 Tax=Actinomadura rupiterrae TaxID=559627 RepID=UPI0020A34B0B|nr:MEDS domain-containing protein [Actinomadura rupiterrae]MCP2334934.1 anti-anti-sigma regulatory factor [Actinomadura rupiterrae]